MSTENLPRDLLNKHLESLHLEKPLYIESEEDFLNVSLNSAQNAIIFLPKSKALIDMTLAFVSGIVVNQGTIILVGSKKGGIESAKKWYETNIGPVEKKIVGNHSALYVGKNTKLGSNKKLEDFLTYFPITYKTTSLEIAHLPGVFSAQELDAGTKLLLEHIPYSPKKVLDIGCGSGVIGSLYKKIVPESTVTMSDVNPLAIRATEETVKKNIITATVIQSNIFSNITGTFDLILCNPPFHTGIETDYSFIEHFSQEVGKHLNPQGQVFIVANSFLPYEQTLKKYLGSTEVIANDNKFKILKSIK